jgi:hypothetical protein
MDFLNYDVPIRYYLTEPIVTQIDTSLEKTLNLLIQNAQTEFYDFIFQYWYHEVSQFFQVEKVFQYEKYGNSSAPPLLTVKIRFDKMMVEYGRISD